MDAIVDLAARIRAVDQTVGRIEGATPLGDPLSVPVNPCALSPPSPLVSGITNSEVPVAGRDCPGKFGSGPRAFVASLQRFGYLLSIMQGTSQSTM